ncbi:MAG: hypothetical protein K0S61_1115 [Anaerocolumna sp.]|jgi:hypothetical protein|nr:hypothetical protein [Anaerocolumna sp.]
MYIGMVINHLIFNFNNITKSLEIFLPVLLIILIAGFFLNKILKILYYIFIEVRTYKNIELKTCRIRSTKCKKDNHLDICEVKKSADTK